LDFSRGDDAVGDDHGAIYLSEGVTMGPLEITGTARLVLGFVTGILFGFILQKAQVTKYDKIVAFFALKDLTVLKVMLAAILSGMVGVYFLHGIGLVNLHIKPTLLGANILGGAIFGVGMLLLGFCPGTCVAAVGEGRLDGLFRGIFGILIGAALYSEIYPFIQNNFLKLGDYGKLTWPTLLDMNPWLVIVPVVIILGGSLVWLDHKGL
jgi:uncharacterized membrane protein YedE/YeeE